MGVELKRKNVSAAGFVSRSVFIRSRIFDYEVSGSVDKVFTLPNTPTKIRSIKGYDEKGRSWTIEEAPGRFSSRDTFTIVGNEITVQSILRNYVEAPTTRGRTRNKGTFFKIGYYINSTYDPNYGVD